MTGREAYGIWAKAGNKWVDWVRPVAFADIEGDGKEYFFSAENLMEPFFLDDVCRRSALIVDLPGDDGVEMGISLAKEGYRPVPVYNGTLPQNGTKAVIDNGIVGKALRQGAYYLKDIDIKADALPAFLTDRNRLCSFRRNSAMFDNSWDLYDQDLPSAEYFIKNGINSMVIVGTKVSEDLRSILWEYQKKGISVYWTKGVLPPRHIRIKKVAFFFYVLKDNCEAILNKL